MANVLLVDDDVSISKLLQLVLRQEGHEMTCAANGRDALDEMRTYRPDMIILDLEMPVMNGRSFFQKIKTMSNRPPVLIVSSFGARSAQEELGAEGSISKPFDPAEVVEAVKRLLAAA